MFRLNQSFWLKLAISAMMALPAPSWAQSSPVPTQPAAATDGVPVAFVPAQLGSEQGYFVVTGVPASHEQAVAAGLAKNNAKGLAVLIKEAADPVFQAIKDSPALKQINVFVASAKRFPAKTQELVKKVTDWAKEEKAGIMFAFMGAGAFGGTITLLMSSGLDTGFKVAAGMLLWYGFLNTAANFWEHILHSGGDRLERGITEFFEKSVPGLLVPDVAKDYARGAGTFGVSWAANTLVASYVMMATGHFESWAVAAGFGFLSNYNVWDMPILKKIKTKAMRLLYFGLQFSVAPVAEAAMYSGNPYAKWALGFTVLSGLAYLIHYKHIDRALTSRGRALHKFLKVKPPVKKCELILDRAGPGIWEDVQ